MGKKSETKMDAIEEMKKITTLATAGWSKEEHQRPGRVQVVQVAPGAGWEPTSALAGRDSGCQHRVEDEGGAVKGRHDAGARQHPVFWEPEVCRVDAGGAQLFKVPPVVDIEEIRP